MKKKYPRDLVGYGSQKVKVKWPGNAKLALQFVLNYEEGAENCTLHLSLIHISEPTRPLYISYAVFCLKKKK